MAGEIDQRHVGALGVLAKIVERPTHAPEIAVGFENDLETELLQRRFHGLAVMDGIGERPDQAVVVIGNHQRHAPLRHRSGGRRQDQQQGKQQAQVEPPPARSFARTFHLFMA